jgi:methyl-accepting chemotaxis protein
MPINSLDRVVNTTFLTKISKASSSGSSSKTTSNVSNQSLEGQALYDTLRIGAQNFAASMQLLNGSATFVNLSRDTNEKLLAIVTKLEKLTDRANRGDISSGIAKRLRSDFEDLADDFDEQIEEAQRNDQDILDLEQLKGVLARAGLDTERVGELALALKRFTHPAEASVNSDGEVVSEGNPVPLDEFKRALRAAQSDEDLPGDDRSGFFGGIRGKLRELRNQLEFNVKALDETTQLLGESMTLVRAAGFAFLDVSNEMTGLESSEEIASRLRERIRGTARAGLGQVHNLERIMIAGMAGLGG